MPTTSVGMAPNERLSVLKHALSVFVAVQLCAAGWNTASAVQIWLKDGRILKGQTAPMTGVAEAPTAPDPEGVGPLHLITVVNDELRWTFVSDRQIENVRQDDSTEIYEKFRIRQQVAHSGPTVERVGPILRVTPFDEFGRRILTMNTNRGPVDVIQCITEITPLWTKVEGHKHVWDMRMSTSSIPPDVLAKILAKQTNPADVDQRKKVAGFYLQSERYEEAYQTLEGILADHPNDAAMRQQLEPLIRAIRQRSAQQLLDELELRRESGQHRLVRTRLKDFPSEGVAGNILERVRQMIQEYESLEATGKESLKRFDELVAKIEDEATRQRIEPIRREIGAELNANTAGRLAAFRLMLDDASLLAEEKVSLAISGWLLGGDSATVKLPVALSVFEVRDLVRQYLNTPDTLSRAGILERFHSQEGATPALVAKLLAHMKPPVDTPPPGAALELQAQPATDTPPATEHRPTDNFPIPEGDSPVFAARKAGQSPSCSEEATRPSTEKPGYYELEVAGLPNTPPVEYVVQLPPEYDPYRRYPAIVTLHGAGTTPSHQVDWWAGSWTRGGWRNGQATRYGYIVIAPGWASEHQKKYGYSWREHAAVLDCLRDACRRFAVDTDRVFLSGHSMGGDAAWDLGLAHPDLWAGVIPIVAESDKYCALYWENAKLVPFYFVGGELDGTKMATNARDLDRYLKRGYNVTVVEYRGRGHEHFSDEILRLFDWMGRYKRDFFPKEFSVSTMRLWDNFFWWVELGSLPPGTVVDPVDWPPSRGTRPMETKASITATNGLYVRTGAGAVRVWLSPEMLDLDKRVNIVVNSRRILPASRFVEPDLETLLEDVRTRGDRQHPFWAKVES